jgi:hypothetical protein
MRDVFVGMLSQVPGTQKCSYQSSPASIEVKEAKWNVVFAAFHVEATESFADGRTAKPLALEREETDFLGCVELPQLR